MAKILLVSSGAANGIPTLATQGVPLRGPNATGEGNFSDHDQACVTVKNSAGTGVLTVKVRMWRYLYAVTDWFPIAEIFLTATMADVGALNGGNAITTVAADTVRFSQVIPGLRQSDRIYAEIIAPGGTGQVFDVYLTLRMSHNW